MNFKYTVNGKQNGIIIIKWYSKITQYANIRNLMKNLFMINGYVLKYPKYQGWNICYF